MSESETQQKSMTAANLLLQAVQILVDQEQELLNMKEGQMSLTQQFMALRDQVNSLTRLEIEPGLRYEELPDYLSVEELQKYLRVGTNKAYELANQKGFPKVQFGSKKVFPKDKVRDWMEKEIGRKEKQLRL